MAETTDATLSRRLLYGTILVGILILCNLGLFGVLLFRSLSAKEINRILLETRSEAEQIARELAGEVERQGGTDLFNALVQEQETQTYIDRVLAQRQIVETVRIYDRSGKLVFENTRERLESGEETPEIEPGRSRLAIETKVLHREIPYDVVEVPVGNVGSFVIGISRTELERRAGQLRADLIRSAAPIAVLTLVVLVGAYLFILWLVRRAKKLEGRAKEAEQLAYIGTLASGLAHEIRSPLNSLNLNMQMLEEEAVVSDRRSNQRGCSRSRGPRSRGSRTWSPTSSPMPGRDPSRWPGRERSICCSSCAKCWPDSCGSGSVEISVDDRTGGAEVEVDRDQMRQLLLNLVQNGVAAAEDAGRRPVREAHRRARRQPGGARRRGQRCRDRARARRAGVRPLLFDAQGRHRAGTRHRPPDRARPRR